MRHAIERLALVPRIDYKADRGSNQSCFNPKDTPSGIDEVSVELPYTDVLPRMSSVSVQSIW